MQSEQLHGTAAALFALPRPGDARRAVPGVVWDVRVAGSVFVTPVVTLGLSGGLNGRTPGRVGDRAAGVDSVEPWTSVGVTVRGRSWDRIGFGVRTSVPIPGLARSDEATVTATVTVSHVRRGALPTPGAG